QHLRRVVHRACWPGWRRTPSGGHGDDRSGIAAGHRVEAAPLHWRSPEDSRIRSLCYVGCPSASPADPVSHSNRSPSAQPKATRAPADLAGSPATFLERYRIPLLLFGAGLVVFCVFSGQRVTHQSLYPHFIYQADAFLHGQLALRVPPPNYEDWARVGDNWYVSFP